MKLVARPIEIVKILNIIGIVVGSMFWVGVNYATAARTVSTITEIIYYHKALFMKHPSDDMLSPMAFS